MVSLSIKNASFAELYGVILSSVTQYRPLKTAVNLLNKFIPTRDICLALKTFETNMVLIAMVAVAFHELACLKLGFL